MSVLQVKNLSFKYETKPLFINASMRIESGSIVGLLGPNGSGKTTFFDIVCGLTKEKNSDITNSFKYPLYLSQHLTTPHTLRMFDIFRITTLLCSSERTTQQRAVEKLARWSPEIIERYKAIWNKKSSICSYGEKRWFFTLTLLTLNSELVILDEPSAGVDPEFRHYIWKCLNGAARDGAAILVSSHNIEEISTNCDYFYMISNHMFKLFHSGSEFIQHYQADSLDQAFISAASSSAISLSPSP
ncbi:ATP-binding cassette domain-containing protein [Pseudomonas sp. NPDC086278]|uniref:ATP-binding cassette domain-containing protein n=1 Tax=Pseudomonas sp. NPDC086278 TaxID=3390646 RepID=UPI003CFE03B8